MANITVDIKKKSIDIGSNLVAIGKWWMNPWVYDPQEIKADVFDMDNMVDWIDKHYLTTEQIEEFENKQDALTAGENIDITNNVISATDTTYTAWEWISIDENNVISNTRVSAEWWNIEWDIEDQEDLQEALEGKQDVLTAGNNVQIENNVISATDTTYTAWQWISIDANNVISNTQTSAEWWNIQWDIEDQADLQAALDDKQDVISDLSEIRSNATAGKNASDTIATYWDIVTHDADEFATADSVGEWVLTIQKNSTTVDTFSANATENKTINITVPTQASDIGALPDTTKYAANLEMSINSSTYVITTQLKDQDGNNIWAARTVDLPLESVVVDWEYDAETKEIILTLENGNTIEFSVADLVSWLQTEITVDNKLDADLVDDATASHKFVTSTEKSCISTAVQPWDLATYAKCCDIPTDNCQLANGCWYTTCTGTLTWPASSTDWHLAVFDWTTGTVVKDWWAIPAESNTKTFYISNLNDLVTGQAAYDWYHAWKNAIIVYDWTSYILWYQNSGQIIFVSSYDSVWSTQSISYVYNRYFKIYVSSDVVTMLVTTTYKTSGNFLWTSTNYSTPYTPEYPWSPATKKYVDDSVCCLAQCCDIPTDNCQLANWCWYTTCTGDMQYSDFEFATLVWDSITLDLSSKITPSADFTINAPATLKDWQIYLLRVQNWASSYTMTLWDRVTNPTSVDLTLTPNTVDQFVFIAVNGVLEMQSDTPDLSDYQTISNMVQNLNNADHSHYPTAKAVADAMACAWVWDMLEAVYDPCWCRTNTFDYCNFYNTPTIPTDNSQLANGCWYTTCTGTLVASDIADLAKCCDIPTDNSQLANGCWYTTCTGTLVQCDIANLAKCCDIPTDNCQLWNGCWYITWINCSDVTSALGYTPYNSTNPAGYTTCTWTLVQSDIANLAQCCDIPTDNCQLANGCGFATCCYVNDSINSVTAYYITKDAQWNQFATHAELSAATTFYSWWQVRVPTKNDYTIVLSDEDHENATTRYIYNSSWEFQYVVNETALTQAQLDALNSWITCTKVSCYDNCMAQCCDIPTDNCQLANGCGYITGINCSDVTSALGYTPYDSTNPAGYTTCTWTLTSSDIAWLAQCCDLDLKQDTLTAWNWIDIDANNKISTTFFYWESTTGASVVQKVVSIPSITELNVWQVIIVKPTVTSTVANSTLKLNDFDAYGMLYNGAAITTSTDSIVWGANIPSMFYLDEVSGTRYWRFLGHWLDSNSTYTINYLYDAWRYKVWTGNYAVTRYSLVMMKPDGTWEKLTATNANYSTWTTKNVNTNWFVLNQIKYYGTTTVLANWAFAATNTFYSQAASVNLSYSFNCGTAPWWDIWDPIYIVWTIWNDGLFYLDTTTRWSNALPSTNDWKLYIRIWTALADDNSTASFLQDRPIFYYDNWIKTYLAADNKQDKSAMVTTLTWADDSHYPTAKAVSDAIQWAWGWDMSASVYDPCGCQTDVFNYCNLYNTPTIPTDNSQLANWCGYTTCTWTLSTCSDITTALWFTPYSAANPNWYTSCTWTLVQSDIANLAQCCDIPTNNNQLSNWCGYTTCTGTLSTCSDVISALWYTPYSSANPSWYTTCTWTLTSADLACYACCCDIPTNNCQLTNWCGYTTCTWTLQSCDIATVNGCCLTNGWDITIDWWNTKTFYLSSTSDLTNAQAAYDWYLAGKNPIIIYSDKAHTLYSKTSTNLIFIGWLNVWLSWSAHHIANSTLSFTLSDNTVTAIGTWYVPSSDYFLKTNYNYSTPYTPAYDWSPATKKYVDDNKWISAWNTYDYSSSHPATITLNSSYYNHSITIDADWTTTTTVAYGSWYTPTPWAQYSFDIINPSTNDLIITILWTQLVVFGDDEGYAHNIFNFIYDDTAGMYRVIAWTENLLTQAQYNSLNAWVRTDWVLRWIVEK